MENAYYILTSTDAIKQSCVDEFASYIASLGAIPIKLTPSDHDFATAAISHLPHVISAYQGEIVGLIKATAVVGYIAVQDLTKMGDIVRSRTYEAFFPLIAITVIYFCLEGLLSLLTGRLEVLLNPRHRSKEQIRKGVTVDD